MIIIAKDSLNNTEVLNDSFQLMWRNGLINSHILMQDGIHLWSLYAFMPFQNDCFALSHFRIATFSSYNFTNNMTVPMELLYPKKLQNFNKCPLYAAVSIIDPLTIIHNSSDGKIEFHGIDIAIINQISKALNFDIIYERSMDGAGHGIIFPNGTVTGNMQLVYIFKQITVFFT